MNCTHCGAPLPKDARFCPTCQRKVKRIHIDTVKEPTFLVKVVSFFLPILGFILYLLFKDTKRTKAKAALKASIIGTVFYIVLGVLFFFLWIFILINVFS